MGNKLLGKRGLVLTLGLGLSGGALAQSTTGAIFGQAPVAEGESVLIKSSTGITREVPVDARGRYSAAQLPLGTYTVTLRRGGQTLQQRENIVLKVGAGSEVSFEPAAAKNLGGISVTASTAPKIDVSSTDSRTVINAQQLAKLPLGRSAEAIALLAPGVVNNGGSFTGPTGNSLASFGGSAASENAYYVNGFNTTDPLRGLGGITLPYGAIDQQEVYTGGYSAMYGRSDGGVINIVGKHGDNQWHAGGQILWEPAFARARRPNVRYENGIPSNPVAGDPTLYAPSSENRSWTTTVSAYGGGPLIKDKLFVFVAGEFERQQGNIVNPIGGYSASKQDQNYVYKNPRWYAKLDWNITDNHILELTAASDKREGAGSLYDYDYSTRTRGGFIGYDDDTKTGGDLWTAKYTGYITDNLTINAQYGKMQTHDYDQPGSYDPDLVYVSGQGNQNPALTGGRLLGNSQIPSLFDPGRSNKTSNTRFDLTYKLGDHTISAGIDNQSAQGIDQGNFTAGPGYSWEYGATDYPNVPISTGLGVPAPADFPNGAGGRYVIRHVAYTLATVRSTQRAQFIEDKWQVNDRWLLSLGLRNDQFKNFNGSGQAFINQHKPQWAPRLGLSWDVHGDSSFKVYGNAGRYYLGMPLNPALNAASGLLYTSQYFTYGGIRADGTPTDLSAFSAPVSSNNYFGQPPDPKTVTAQNLKSEYQDEFILGFTKTAGSSWVYGAKLTQRILRNAIDDYCDRGQLRARTAALGYQVTFEGPGASNPASCWLINPGKANTFTLVDTSGNYRSVKLNNAQFGFPRLKRRYYGLENFIEHPFDGSWYGKLSYVFSRSYGNTEGQLRSDLYSESRSSGQPATSTTQDWDNSYLMEYANGIQNNDHKHQIKFFGYWQIAAEWLISGNVSLISGAPKSCLGAYGVDASDPAGYGNTYHYCYGQPAPPGSQGRLPWVRNIDLGVTYRPSFAAQRLGFSANVFNVFNEQRVTGIFPNSVTSGRTPNPLYGTATARQLPRYMRLSVSYDY